MKCGEVAEKIYQEIHGKSVYRSLPAVWLWRYFVFLKMFKNSL